MQSSGGRAHNHIGALGNGGRGIVSEWQRGENGSKAGVVWGDQIFVVPPLSSTCCCPIYMRMDVFL